MSGKHRAMIVAARRTPVCPRGGALADLQADELAAPVLAALIADSGLAPEAVGQVLLGNALYGGGNPARLAALRAGLPPSVPALTVDTQCCSGLDAILMGARLVEAGAADCVIAGGAESFSRSPVRMHRPRDREQQPVPYHRPPFAPEPFADPDLAEAAAGLAARNRISRAAQAEFAVRSHEKARAAFATLSPRLVRPDPASPDRDTFARNLRPATALRAPVIAGNRETGLDAATVACEADGAAAVLLVSGRFARRNKLAGLKITDGSGGGGDPADPALVPNDLARQLLKRNGLTAADLTAVELMEAYAVQAMVTAEALAIPPDRLNLLGGALSRGHPIGASGAILAVQLFECWRTLGKVESNAQFTAMALIAAAGGLASGLLVSA